MLCLSPGGNGASYQGQRHAYPFFAGGGPPIFQGSWETQTVRAHIKVDTGMGRLGVPTSDAPQLIQVATKLPHLEINYLYTHYASAEDNASFSCRQRQAFRHWSNRSIKTSTTFTPTTVRPSFTNRTASTPPARAC